MPHPQPPTGKEIEALYRAAEHDSDRKEVAADWDHLPVCEALEEAV